MITLELTIVVQKLMLQNAMDLSVIYWLPWSRDSNNGNYSTVAIVCLPTIVGLQLFIHFSLWLSVLYVHSRFFVSFPS